MDNKVSHPKHMTLDEFNQMAPKELGKRLLQCCGASQWVKKLISKRPYPSIDALEKKSTNIWERLDKDDWLEAFAQHPQIGGLSTLPEKDLAASQMAASEQSATVLANESVLETLAKYNRLYFEKFGYIFIISATGKDAQEMLENLKQRLPNGPKQEILIAAEEQNKIIILRLKKLIK